MVKSLFSFGLFVVFVVNIMSSSIVQLNFKLNRDFIVQNLCVNKNEVSSNCKGRCYLTRQLKEDKENKNKENPYNLAGEQFNLFFQKNFDQQITITIVKRKSLEWFETIKFLQKGYVDQLELPPEGDAYA